MREIKFRVWHKASKKMYYNIDVHCDGVLKAWDDKGDNSQLLTGVLMQYTGLKDKSSKEIYFDDLAKHEDSMGIRVGKVVWNERMCGMGIEFKDTTVFGGKELFENCEIVGNIHENPKLLTND